MIKIPVSELKGFLNKADKIKDRSIAEITRYIKLESLKDVVTLTKTNLESFVVHEIEAKAGKDFVILLEEKMFANAVNQSSGDEMKITYKDIKESDKPKDEKKKPEDGMARNVTMQDGGFVNVTFQVPHEQYFPKIASHEQHDAYTLSPDIVEAIVLASKHTLAPKGNIQYEQYVHITNQSKKLSYICGYNRAILYYKIFKEELPNMVIDATACAALQPYIENGVILYKGEKYDFYETGKTVYGFIQSYVKGPAFDTIVGMKEAGKFFTADRTSLIAFCKLAIGFNSGTVMEPCVLSNGESDKTLLLDKVLSNVRNPVQLEIEKSKKFTVPKFQFDPGHLMTLLESVPGDQVNLSGPTSGNIYVNSEEDADYTGAIREILNNTEGNKSKPATEKAEVTA